MNEPRILMDLEAQHSGVDLCCRILRAILTTNTRLIETGLYPAYQFGRDRKVNLCVQVPASNVELLRKRLGTHVELKPRRICRP